MVRCVGAWWKLSFGVVRAWCPPCARVCRPGSLREPLPCGVDPAGVVPELDW